MSEKVFRIRESDSIRDEASQWVINLEQGRINEGDIDLFLQWLDRSSCHRQEFAELVSLWGNMDGLACMADIIPFEAGQPTSSVPAEVVGTWSDRIKSFWEQLSSQWRFKLVVPVASIMLISLLGLFHLSGYQPWNQWLSSDYARYVTDIGRQQNVKLDDGSLIQLNTNSVVEVDYSHKRRDIYLKRGEAHFHVEHNPQRPFVVHAGSGSVVAVGTAFNVHYQKGIVDVIVTEGIVEIQTSLFDEDDIGAAALSTGTDATGTDGVEDNIVTKVQVAIGHHASFDQIVRSVKTVEPDEIERELAWQQGMLIFEGKRLEDAINEVSRYTRKKIVIQGAEIRDLPIGGAFKTGDTAPLLDALQFGFGVTVTHVGDNLVVLSKTRESHAG